MVRHFPCLITTCERSILIVTEIANVCRQQGFQLGTPTLTVPIRTTVSSSSTSSFDQSNTNKPTFIPEGPTPTFWTDGIPTENAGTKSIIRAGAAWLAMLAGLVGFAIV
jgi:hypothetical protein